MEATATSRKEKSAKRKPRGNSQRLTQAIDAADGRREAAEIAETAQPRENSQQAELLLQAELPEAGSDPDGVEAANESADRTAPDHCVICDSLKPSGIRVLEKFICDECEAEMVKTDVTDDKYAFFIRQMHKLWLPKDA